MFASKDALGEPLLIKAIRKSRKDEAAALVALSKKYLTYDLLLLTDANGRNALHHAVM